MYKPEPVSSPDATKNQPPLSSATAHKEIICQVTNPRNSRSPSSIFTQVMGLECNKTTQNHGSTESLRVGFYVLMLLIFYLNTEVLPFLSSSPP